MPHLNEGPSSKPGLAGKVASGTVLSLRSAWLPLKARTGQPRANRLR